MAGTMDSTNFAGEKWNVTMFGVAFSRERRNSTSRDRNNRLTLVTLSEP
jgi:hypothetical protein